MNVVTIYVRVSTSDQYLKGRVIPSQNRPKDSPNLQSLKGAKNVLKESPDADTQGQYEKTLPGNLAYFPGHKQLTRLWFISWTDFQGLRETLPAIN